jgi:putative addiction module killer protein
MKTIEHYRDSTGWIPFQTWFQTLRDKVAKASIARRLDRLAIGNPGDHKAVREGVSELRIDVGSGYRVYYAEQGERLVILLCGGDKSTQRKDIELALEYWADWKRRRK